MSSAHYQYTVEYDPKAIKELSRLDEPVARRIVKAVRALAAELRPPGCRELTGYPGLWRIRVGNYRVVYTIKDAELLVLALRVAHRSRAYRRLSRRHVTARSSVVPRGTVARPCITEEFSIKVE